MAHQYQHPSMFKLAKAAKQLVPSEMVPASHQQPRHSEEDVGTNLSEFNVLPETKLAPSKYRMPSTPSDGPKPGTGLTQNESSTCVSGPTVFPRWVSEVPDRATKPDTCTAQQETGLNRIRVPCQIISTP